jgi:hypothetical protein
LLVAALFAVMKVVVVVELLPGVVAAGSVSLKLDLSVIVGVCFRPDVVDPVRTPHCEGQVEAVVLLFDIVAKNMNADGKPSTHEQRAARAILCGA